MTESQRLDYELVHEGIRQAWEHKEHQKMHDKTGGSVIHFELELERQMLSNEQDVSI